MKLYQIEYLQEVCKYGSFSKAADALLIIREGRVLHHGECGSRETHEALVAAFDGRIVVHEVDGQFAVLPKQAR